MSDKPEDMNDEQLTRFLAVEVMGWTLGNGTEYYADEWFEGKAFAPFEGVWDPLNNAYHMLRLIEAMREKDYLICVNPAIKAGYEAKAIDRITLSFRTWTKQDTAQRAVALAAAKAVQSMKDQS